MIKELALVGVGVLLGKYYSKKNKHGKCSGCGCSKHSGKHSRGHHHHHHHKHEHGKPLIDGEPKP